MGKAKASKDTIDPRTIRTRDPLMVAVINGATKAGVHRDRRKDENRRACRKAVRGEE